ncbi:TRAP transporter small permease [Afifella sp. IM 167]|uniref:TRAP transporter small permease n=1 Tax=Afifella sp. IM 167 TaxID=2033586 RepID=UPI001CC9C91F|nr:TRAP transporter small permease [Afifella sp. IM 167]
MPEEEAAKTAVRQGPFDRALAKAVQGGGLISAAATFILMAHVIVDVAMRYLANAPLPATIEIVSYWWMVLITFPALALTQRRREHVDLSLLTELMPARHRRVSIIMARVATLAVVLIIGWCGWLYALEQMARGEIAMGSVTIPIWPTRFAVPLGMLLFALQLTANLIEDLRGRTAGPGR